MTMSDEAEAKRERRRFMARRELGNIRNLLTQLQQKVALVEQLLAPDDPK
jgi:hypothetical protein